MPSNVTAKPLSDPQEWFLKYFPSMYLWLISINIMTFAHWDETTDTCSKLTHFAFLEDLLGNLAEHRNQNRNVDMD